MNHSTERAAEEHAFRYYLHILNIKEWQRERERLGLPHPCSNCEESCKRCHIPQEVRR